MLELRGADAAPLVGPSSAPSSNDLLDMQPGTLDGLTGPGTGWEPPGSTADMLRPRLTPAGRADLDDVLRQLEEDPLLGPGSTGLAWIQWQVDGKLTRRLVETTEPAKKRRGPPAGHRADTLQRATVAREKRAEGMKWEEIAEALSYGSAQAARQLAKKLPK